MTRPATSIGWAIAGLALVIVALVRFPGAYCDTIQSRFAPYQEPDFPFTVFSRLELEACCAYPLMVVIGVAVLLRTARGAKKRVDNEVR
jgi:hypothetical protein